MGVLPACIHAHHIRIWCPWRPVEGIGFPGTGITDSYELLGAGKLWVPGLNPGPLEKQLVCLAADSSSLKLCYHISSQLHLVRFCMWTFHYGLNVSLCLCLSYTHAHACMHTRAHTPQT